MRGGNATHGKFQPLEAELDEGTSTPESEFIPTETRRTTAPLAISPVASETEKTPETKEG